jgi:dTDP-4-dehydrorhamnose reductase/beta-phosphoglucomutase-like phosphatase (HAD superfamily)
MIFVLGGSGLVGRATIELLEKEGVEYIATYRTRAPSVSEENQKKWIHLDSSDERSLIALFAEHTPMAAINCIVQRQVETCESDWNDTKATNIDLVAHLASACLAHNVHLIHISTDYVFDGKKQQNAPDSPTNPLQNYGISKRISEYRVLNSGCKHTIVRVPVLYWDKLEQLDESAVTLIGKKVLNQIVESREDDYSIRRPVYIPDFCRFLLQCVKDSKYGLYHYYQPKGAWTKYQIAKQIAILLGQTHSHIRPMIPSISDMTSRPYDTDLCDPQYTHSYEQMDLEEGLRRCFGRFIHPPLLCEGAKGEENQMFLMFDLDGTLVDTDRLHYESYRAAASEGEGEGEGEGVHIPWPLFEKHINTGSIDLLLEELSVRDIEGLKQRKKAHFMTHKDVKFVSGAQELLEHCIKEKMNIVIVTNTSAQIVEFLKSKLPVLASIPQWIVREDYTQAKPSDECYALAVSRFYRGEKYRIGFENTINGYNALRGQCQCVYFITNKDSYNYKHMAKQDVYLYKDFVAKWTA